MTNDLRAESERKVKKLQVDMRRYPRDSALARKYNQALQTHRLVYQVDFDPDKTEKDPE